MAEQNAGVWGIDVGQSALKALRLELIDGQVTATAFDYVEHPKILNQPDADPDQLTREALEKFLSRNSLRGDTVAVSVPGQSGLARFVKLPPVEEKKIPDIVRFEAKQQIPFPLDEVVWDYQKIGSGAVTDGFAMETEIGLFAIKRDMVNRAMQQFKEVDIEVHTIQMAPLALCNYLAYDVLHKGGEGDGAKPKGAGRECVVALDIGTDNSNLVITDGERVIWQRPIPFGGNHFTRALTKDLKLTFAKAEHLKRNATKSPDLKKILSALKPVLNDFVGEVQRSLGYFTNTHRNAHVAYLLGLGNAFRLPGLQKFLSEKLQLEVRKLTKMDRLAGEAVVGEAAFSQNVMSFATAYGLAVQGLDLGRIKTNLLPQDVRFERLIRAKKPWAVAAAAALLFGTLAATVSYALQYRAVDTSGPVGKEIEASKPVVNSINGDKSAVSEKEAQVKTRETEVRNVIAGQTERLNWLLFNEYLNECMPAPGMRLEGKLKSKQGDSYVVECRDQSERTFEGSKTLLVVGGKPVGLNEVKPGDAVAVLYNSSLNPKAQVYWTPQARAAFYNIVERQAAGKAGDKGQDDLKNLIQVNVESVVPVYTQDLAAYYNQVKPEMEKRYEKDFARMFTEDELKAPPPGGQKAWLVEIRGYTYHEDPLPFLLNTLHQNLVTKAKPAGGESTAAPKAEGGKASPPTPEQERRQLWDKVIANKIKYVVLYDYKQTQPSADAGAAKFELIDKPVVGKFLTAAASATTQPTLIGKGAGAAQAPVDAGPGSTGWVPLIPMDLGAGSGGPGSGGLPAPVTVGAGKAPGGDRLGLPPTPGAPGTERPAPAAKAPAQRTEFIILLAWLDPDSPEGAGPARP
jgi:type IV pilus assembly protein PilM